MNGFQLLTIVAKLFILDVCGGPSYAFVTLWNYYEQLAIPTVPVAKTWTDVVFLGLQLY